MARPADPPPPDWLRAARDHWQWRGQGRPPFAVVPGPGQTSVWDHPRPPVLTPEPREVSIHWGGVEIARTRRAIRVLETAHPPSFYLPWDDVQRQFLEAAPGGSFCEWKGPARYWSLLDPSPLDRSLLDRSSSPASPVDRERRLPGVAWSYPRPLAGAEALADCVAFYPHRLLACRVGDALVRPQPGGFYGGWITPELTGPFKGEAGSEGW